MDQAQVIGSADTLEVRRLADDVTAEVERVIVGKRDTVLSAVLTVLCGGHILIEDIPGVGKTTLAKALAIAIGGEFRRIQFTPDLLPSDVTGASIFNQKEGLFEFRPGPLFANIVLVDEINRATPKTQSALLEAMEERQITSDGVTRLLSNPFCVVATQNNVEMTGTFPLPEAQMDRFFSRIRLGYPSREDETEILRRQQTENPIDSIRQVTTLEAVVKAQATIREIAVRDVVRQYAVDIVRATRSNGMLTMGASPRGSLYLLHAAQASAAMDGSTFVRPDDIKRVAAIILGHRLMVRGEVSARGTANEAIVSQILETVPAPVPVG